MPDLQTLDSLICLALYVSAIVGVGFLFIFTDALRWFFIDVYEIFKMWRDK